MTSKSFIYLFRAFLVLSVSGGDGVDDGESQTTDQNPVSQGHARVVCGFDVAGYFVVGRPPLDGNLVIVGRMKGCVGQRSLVGCVGAFYLARLDHSVDFFSVAQLAGLEGVADWFAHQSLDVGHRVLGECP